MTTARCPLVREIEETAASWHGPGTYPTAAQVDAYFIVEDNVFYARLRAALEAAEEMAEYAEKVTDAPGLWMAAKRYRAATRTEKRPRRPDCDRTAAAPPPTEAKIWPHGKSC